MIPYPTISDLAFISESNKIEGIQRHPTSEEIYEYCRFMALPSIQLNDLTQFVSVYQPDAQLRDRTGMNVMVGGSRPPFGDITVKTRLMDIISTANTHRYLPTYAYQAHLQYETLHPFMDCNGRSGRMLWKWMMGDPPLGFLHSFYYQTLAASGRK